jgi:hypothetical protein
VETPLPAAMPPRRLLVMAAAVVEAHQPLLVVETVVGAHRPLLMAAAVAVKEAAVYSAEVPRPLLPAEAAETEAHSRLLVAELRHPRLPVTAVVAATMVATMVAVASVALRATPPDEPPIRSLLLRSRKNVHRERRNRWSGRPSPFRKPPPRLRNPAVVPLSR